MAVLRKNNAFCDKTRQSIAKGLCHRKACLSERDKKEPGKTTLFIRRDDMRDMTLYGPVRVDSVECGEEDIRQPFLIEGTG